MNTLDSPESNQQKSSSAMTEASLWIIGGCFLALTAYFALLIRLIKRRLNVIKDEEENERIQMNIVEIGEAFSRKE